MTLRDRGNARVAGGISSLAIRYCFDLILRFAGARSAHLIENCSSASQRIEASRLDASPYRCRWTIETLFGNLKTKGSNLEDTYINDHGKLSTLLAVLAMAVASYLKTGAAAAQMKPIPVESHGRKAVSLFALGLQVLRKIFTAAAPSQVTGFLKALLSPKISLKPLKSMSI